MSLSFRMLCPSLLALAGLAIGCQSRSVEDVGEGTDDVSETPACWTAGENGAPRWDASSGHQVAYVDRTASGSRQLDLSIDGRTCHLTAGMDDYAIAFARGGRKYAFLSTRTGEVDLFVVDMDGGPVARKLGCAAHGLLVDVPPVFTDDGSLIFAIKPAERAPTLYRTRLDAEGCAATRLFELPVAFSRTDVLQYVGYDGDPSGSAQATYDAELARLLDEAIARQGSELAALGLDSLTRVSGAPSLEHLRRTKAGAFTDRLADLLATTRGTNTLRGIALDPGDSSGSRLAVVNGMTGLAVIHDGRNVAFRITPADVSGRFFSEGLSWQGSKMAFSVISPGRLPRTIVWDANRQLTDDQIRDTLADRAQSWGTMFGLRRHAGGMLVEHALDGSQPALGPAGGRGAPRDGERIAFRHEWIEPTVCGDRHCRERPSLMWNVQVGNHWDVSRGGDPVRPLTARAQSQGQPTFRP